MKWLTDRIGLTTAEEETVVTEESTKKEPSKALIRAKISGKIRRKEDLTSEDLSSLAIEDYRTPINKQNGFTLLHRAVFEKRIQAIYMIMEASSSIPPYGLFPNSEYGTALHLAANSNDSVAIEAILTSGINSQVGHGETKENARRNIIETRDSKNQTPFIAAVFSGSEDAINEMLQDGGVNYAYTCKEESGRRKYYCAFSSAAQSTNPQVFYDIFTRCGKNLNTKDYNGKTCLDYALEFQNPDAIKFLSTHPHILHLDNLQALVDAKTALSQSGDNPEFQAVVSKAVDLLAAKNKVVPLTKLVEGPELSLGTPVEFEVQNEVTTTAATHEEEKSSALDTDPSRTTESDEDSQQEQNPELNAPRSRNIIADVIDGNREENIARRKA